MIEVHCHVLPGIDDGAKNVEESIGLLKLLKKQGVSSVVLTPHFYPDDSSLEEFLACRDKSFFELQTGIKAMEGQGEELNLPLILASETLISKTLLSYESILPLCIGDTRYLMFELPYTDEWSGSIFRLIDKLISKFGITPIIAHIERYEPVRRKPDKIIDVLLDIGCVLQMNIGTVVNRSDRRYGLKLIKKGYIDLVGSDCHNLSNRAPQYDEFQAIVERKLGKDYIKIWNEAAEEILKG